MIMYGDGGLYGDAELYIGLPVMGTWEQSYSFTYVAGTTVYLTIDAVQTVPVGSYVKYYAGETTDNYEEIPEGIETPVLFTSTTSGSDNLHIKIEMYSNGEGSSVSVDSISLTVRQQTSLYTTAVQVLSDGLAPSSTSYFIDPWLQTIPLEYSWLDVQSHRSALAKIGDACGGRAFQASDGTIRLESARYLSNNGTTVQAIINQDRILSSNTPVSEIFNTISIRTKPYKAQANATVWTLESDNIINNGQSRTFDVFFNDYDAVIDSAAVLSSSPAGATISSETWYTWGGRVTILGSADGQELTLTVEGKALVVSGSRIIEETDGASIRLNGEIVHEISNNNLIQDAVIVEDIAEAILAETKDSRRDLEGTWRGDPTLELNDLVTWDGINAKIISQEFQFNGALSCNTRLKRTI